MSIIFFPSLCSPGLLLFALHRGSIWSSELQSLLRLPAADGVPRRRAQACLTPSPVLLPALVVSEIFCSLCQEIVPCGWTQEAICIKKKKSLHPEMKLAKSLPWPNCSQAPLNPPPNSASTLGLLCSSSAWPDFSNSLGKWAYRFVWSPSSFPMASRYCLIILPCLPQDSCYVS